MIKINAQFGMKSQNNEKLVRDQNDIINHKNDNLRFAE